MQTIKEMSTDGGGDKWLQGKAEKNSINRLTHFSIGTPPLAGEKVKSSDAKCLIGFPVATIEWEHFGHKFSPISKSCVSRYMHINYSHKKMGNRKGELRSNYSKFI